MHNPFRLFSVRKDCQYQSLNRFFQLGRFPKIRGEIKIAGKLDA